MVRAWSEGERKGKGTGGQHRWRERETMLRKREEARRYFGLCTAEVGGANMHR